MTENEIASEVVDSAYRIHKLLGPGLLESVYETILAAELEERGLHITRQQGIPVVYKHKRLSVGFRADLIVEGKVILEIKSTETLAEIHKNNC
jgi:GxxExxY protein